MTATGGPPEERPPGWTPADEALRRRLEADERRLAADEQRLALDERGIRRNTWLAVALSAVLALTIVALVLSVVALNRDIDAIARAEPHDDSVGTAALQAGVVTREKIAGGAVGADQLADGAVTSTKLGEGAVTSSAIAASSVLNNALAPGSVGTGKLRAGAVTGERVAPDTLTGDNIRESTLSEVPRAAEAEQALTAEDAESLGGLAAGRYLSRPELVQAASESTGQAVKGPVTAACPAGTRVIGGGAAIDGGPGVALTASAPDGETGWTGSAEELGRSSGPWRLVVTAICVRGG